MNDLKEIKVLYVEDDEEHAKLVSKMLNKCERINFKINYRGDLQSSLDYLKSVDCDVDAILLDLMLPNSQGVNTFKKVYDTCKVPVVILSGFEDIAHQCIELGAQDYLVKPDISPSLIARSLEYSIERKKLIEKQKNLERQFSDVINSTPLGVHMYELVDGELYFCGYNPASDKILNIDHSPLVGMKIEHAFPDIKGIRDEYIKVIETGEAWIAKRVDYEDDKVKGSFSVYAFRTNKNKMATTFEDITIKSKIQDKLKDSQEKYKELVEATGAAIYEVDFVTRKFTYVNDVMCKLTGWSKEEFLELGPEDFLTEKGLREFAERLEALSQGKFIEHTHEYQIKIKDGSLRWSLITAIFKEDDKGNVLGASVVAIDITDKKMAEEEAKIKEEIIFSELEHRIHEWREEINLKSIANKVQLDEISLNIELMNKAGV